MKKQYKIGFLTVIKVLTTLFFGYYLYSKFKSGTFSVDYTPQAPMYLLFAFLLTPLNWFLEAAKWKLLANRVERISFFTAVKSVLAGLASSLVTPFRLGDPLGKIIFLQEDNRVEGAMLSVIGSLTQLVVTIIAGFAGMYIISSGQIADIFGEYYGWGIGILALVVVLFVVGYNIIKRKYAEKLKSVLSIGLPLLASVFGLSMLRYLLFIAQFIFVFAAYGDGENQLTIAVMTTIYFFMVAVVPMFIIAEPGMRGAIALVAFAGFSTAFTVATMVWMLNVLLPATFGLIFLLLQKSKNTTAQPVNPLPSQP
ncbi:MAG: flippase-like domain-containing protein [Sphingobacteriales bacterium JAD_PAG50586_3]|nr:MAG: flippase-like domain-containing protein [Sphingobacteriales bacterium JAD_PAG50586_3]